MPSNLPTNNFLLDAVRRDDQVAVIATASEVADACIRDDLPWSCLAEAFTLGHRGCVLRMMEAMPALSPASKQCVLQGMFEGPIDDPVLFLRLLDRGAELPLGRGLLPIEHECATLKHPRLVEAMFRRLKLRHSVIDGEGWTPFLRAIHAGDTATAKIFLDHGAQINARIRSAERRSALHLAQDTDNPTMITAWLLRLGIDPALADGSGRTAAQLAEAQGNHDIARQIGKHDPAGLHWNGEIAGKVNPDFVDSEGWRPFLRAIQAGNTAMAQVFLNIGADINTRIEWKDRRGALHLALDIADEPERVVVWLLERGIDINLFDDARRTAAQLAEQQGQCTLARLIKDYRGFGGPLWHRNAVERNEMRVICTYRNRAEGLGFAPSQATHPFILGGDHDGFWRATPRQALEHIKWHYQYNGAYHYAQVWIPLIERMLSGEEISLDELLPLGMLEADYTNYYQD